MANPSEIACAALSLQVPPTKLNYYSLLELDEFTENIKLIQAALQSAVTKLKSNADAMQAEQLNVVKKLLQQSHAVLLSPEKKVKYDLQLKKQLQNSSPTEAVLPVETPGVKPPANQPPTSQQQSAVVLESTDSKVDAIGVTQEIPVETLSPKRKSRYVSTDPFSQLLPTADATDEFHMRSFLNSAPLPPPIESVQDRLEALKQLENPNMTHNAAAVVAKAAGGILLGGTANNSETGRAIADRIRKKRALQNLLSVGGLSLAAIALLAYAGYMFLKRDANKNSSVATVTKNDTEVDVSPADITPEKSQASKDGQNLAIDKAGDNQALGSLPKVGAIGASADGKSFTDMPMQAGQDNADQNGATNDASPAKMLKMDGEFGKILTQAREAIAKHEFKRFDQLYEKLSSLDQNNNSSANILTRLDRTAQLSKLGRSSFEEAVNKLRSGEAIEMRDADPINFVERKDGNITYRQAGKSVTVSLEKLPLDVLQSVLDLGLGKNAAVDLAARSVFIKLYNGTAEYQNAAQAAISQATKLEEKFGQLDDLDAAGYAR